MKEKPESVFRVVAPMRSLSQRFAFLLMLGTAIGLLLIGRTDPLVFERARMALMDSAAPILDALSRPAATVAATVDRVRELAHIRRENAHLKAENARLLQWQHAARILLAENNQLRDLLNFTSDATIKSVAARVIGDSNGPFIRSLVVNAGSSDGIRQGQAALTGEGLVGRVAATGERSARVLLIGDLNSRIPVLVESSRTRAMLAGDNTGRPRLMFLSIGADLSVGDRIVTSGHGGMFPAGLPVGVVAEIGEAGVRVQPFAEPGRLEYLRIVDFGLQGVIVDVERAATAKQASRNP